MRDSLSSLAESFRSESVVSTLYLETGNSGGFLHRNPFVRRDPFNRCELAILSLQLGFRSETPKLQEAPRDSQKWSFLVTVARLTHHLEPFVEPGLTKTTSLSFP